MYSKLLKCMYKIDVNPVFSSIKRGFLLLFPIIMTGALALLLQTFPVPAFQGFLAGLWDGGIDHFLSCVHTATMGFLAVYLVLSVSFYYSGTFSYKNTSVRILCMAVSLICFFASFGAVSGSLELVHFGSTGVFTALLCAILATRLFLALYGITSRYFHSKAMGADADYKSAMTAVVPLLFCTAVFVLGNLLISSVFHVNNLNELISQGLISLFKNTNGSLGGGVLYTFLLNFLWMFGIHGGNVLEPVAQSVLLQANTDPSQIISKTFLDNFALMGGSGAALCLVIAMLFFSKSKSTRGLARSAAPLTLFNINELVVFGYPVIFNPILMIPFILVPICALALSYTATKLGFIPVINETVGWTTPVFFSGYFATNSWNGVLVQLASVAIGTGLYIPFIRLADKMQTSKQGMAADDLARLFREGEEHGQAPEFLERGDAIGLAARSLVQALRADLERERIPMFYQPQVNREGETTGAEALLRWQYAGKTVYPPLLISLAREEGLLEKLTLCILNRVSRDTRRFLDGAAKPDDFQISANITAFQLGDPAFIEECIRLVHTYEIEGHFCLEVTEESSLNYFDTITSHIDLLRKNGIVMAIDDFSMGHTSLKYLETSQFQYVKLDGGLVRQALTNERCREIISSITTLGDSLNFVVVAEYVENEEIRATLERLGCSCYQGYLYSPAIPADQFLEKVRK